MNTIIWLLMLALSIFMIYITIMFPLLVIGIGVCTYVVIFLASKSHKRRNDAANKAWAEGDKDA